MLLPAGFTIMSTVGFGDISAGRSSERLITVIVMMAGSFNFGVIMQKISQIVRHFLLRVPSGLHTRRDYIPDGMQGLSSVEYRERMIYRYCLVPS